MKKEFEILELLMVNKNYVLTREIIKTKIWRDNYIESNSLDVHIKNLRDKIDRKYNVKIIKTIYGVGYKICDSD